MDDPRGLGGCSASVFGLFWHKQHTYALTMGSSELLLPPEPHQYTSDMLLIDIGCSNSGSEKVSLGPILGN